MTKKSHMAWSWSIIVSFFILSIMDYRFGILGFICMGAPIYHAIKGRGKIHCAKYCPRGSFLGRWIKYISFNRNTIPKWMNTKTFKNSLLTLMVLMLGFSIYHSNFEFHKIAFALFRFMGVSFLVGILMGVFFKPRSWCQICPMGHATGLVNKKKRAVTYNQKEKKAA